MIGAGDQRWAGWLAAQREQLDLLDESSFERLFELLARPDVLVGRLERSLRR